MWINFKSFLKTIYSWCFYEYKKLVFGSIMSLIMFYLALDFYVFDKETRIIHKNNVIEFKDGVVIGTGKSIYERKELILSSKLKNLEDSNKELREAILALHEKFNELEAKKQEPPEGKVDFSSPTDGISVKKVETDSSDNGDNSKYVPHKRKKIIKRDLPGPAIISFPVEGKENIKENAITLPAGSFVKAKLLTGVEAPEGKALPVLLQADYAFIGPNNTKVDLSGCFLIAKSTGNLSIERVEMQTTKISCVAKSGKMFEKDLNGFVADDKDNSFAIMGKINTKQDRVAAMAFLSSVVEGVGKAISQAQMSTSTSESGASSSSITGNQGKYIAAGGASNAASMVTTWYLKQAQNLLPTINIGSGQDLWIVLQDMVHLPSWYFRKNNKEKHNGYSYLSRLIE